MSTKPGRDDYPIAVHLPQADVALIDRAAGLRGRSRTEFMRDAAVSAAESVLMERHLVTLSPEDFATFLSALSAPAAPVPEIVEVLERAAPWEPGYTARR